MEIQISPTNGMQKNLLSHCATKSSVIVRVALAVLAVMVTWCAHRHPSRRTLEELCVASIRNDCSSDGICPFKNKHVNSAIVIPFDFNLVCYIKSNEIEMEKSERALYYHTCTDITEEENKQLELSQRGKIWRDPFPRYDERKGLSVCFETQFVEKSSNLRGTV